MVLTVTLNPSVDHALFLDRLVLGDTNRVQRVETDAGGKGVNLSRVYAELGGATTATGFLGGSSGDYVRTVVAAQGVTDAFLSIDGVTRTNFSVEVAEGTPPTTFNQRGPEVTAGDWERLLSLVRERVPGFEWLALGGSLPPGVGTDAFRQLGAIAHEVGVNVMLDADGEALREGLAVRPDFIKPNAAEAGRLLGSSVKTQAEALEAATQLLDQVSLGGFVVLSRGADGAILARQDELYVGHSPTVQVRSTIGSGDSMIAGILFGLGQGLPIQEAFRWGLAAGAATATTDGSEIGRRSVIESLLPNARVERAQ